MLQPLQIEDVSVRYAREIAELREFLAKAGQLLDTAASLHGVTTRLREDRTFRRDLTSHAWVALHGGKQQARHADLLAMLAVAAAGPRFAADAADTEAHDLLRFVMQVWSSFHAVPENAQQAPVRTPVASAVASSVASHTFERESALSFEMPLETEDRRRVVWIGAAAACVLLAMVSGLWRHYREPAKPAAQVASIAAPPAEAQTPQVFANRDEGHPAQLGEATTAVARRPSHLAPYSPLPESLHDLPDAASSRRTKPSPAIPMASVGPAAAAARPVAARPMSTRSGSTPNARPSRPSAAAQPVTSASNGSSFVPKAVPVDGFTLRGGLSAGTTRQAIVRPTSLGIMAANVTYSPAPVYPATAAAARVQGEVKLEAEVGRDGTVESTRIISGPPLLAASAAGAVQHWRYRPYLYEGKPVAMNAQIVMDFQLP